MRLREVAWVFLKLGTTAFGGPAAHIAMMEDEVVRRRAWLTREAFLDYVGATNLIPGPNSTELAIHIGHARAGWAGLLVAGVSFIVPAALIVSAAAWAYVRYGTLAGPAGILYGIKPIVIAVVAQALWRLGITAIKSALLAVVAVLAASGAAAGIHEMLILLIAGVLTAGATARPVRSSRVGVPVLAGIAGSMGLNAAAMLPVSAPFGLLQLFAVFAKAGAVLFGSGYVLLAFLRADLVERLGWLTEPQLLDAIAIGQVTPGPVFTTATFIGFILGGPVGAFVATVGIFLPAFVFVAISGPVVPRLRRSAIAGRALDGINAASLGLMAAVTWQLGRAALTDLTTISLACLSLLALVLFRINSAWLIIAGAIIGWTLS